MAAENGVALIGGDTCSSRSGLAVSVTIMGEQHPDRIVRRTGAMPDDDIWVTGTLGDAALVLKLLENSEPVSDRLLSSLLDPNPRVSAALALVEAGLVTSMIDISDGVLADYGHIGEQSGVGGCIRLDDLPLSAGFRSYAATLPTIPYHLALSGGEDYELCFTGQCSNREKIIDCMKKCGIEVTRIGIVTSLPGVTAINQDGSPHIARTEGFNHFT